MQTPKVPELRKVAVNLSATQHQALRLVIAKLDTTMQDFLTSALNEKLSQHSDFLASVKIDAP